MSRLKNDGAIKNPCLKEQELTYKCFNDNNYDHSKCQLYIENYKTCKTFWHHVKMDRQRRGIRPYIPDVEDREQVKKEFLHKTGL
ncbi:hypothetical protein WA026_002998 [Henosepilachna vigintioctopunctata]|uniref:Coiled-coil-helix-coiled-coil-helix domain-containing protein 7 n=1 Tax=Henosepilachna vigintioctopunctata TaxID=420089 RepID=A0AAW1TL75_9CUCU